jgi:long-chain acyl-CoA synthetase
MSTGLEYWAEKNPAKLAIVDGNQSLTFEELNRRADSLAEWLFSEGVDRETTVATKCRVRWEWFVINLALAKLGAIHVSASFALTRHELAPLLEQTGVQILFSDASSDCDVDPIVRTINIDGSDFSAFADLLCRASVKSRQALNPASLVIFTAGTSGTPKGALINFERLAQSSDELTAYREDQLQHSRNGDWNRTLFCRPLHHLAGPVQAWGCLSAGGSLYLMRRFDALDALQTISREGITHVGIVPTMGYRMLSLSPESIQDLNLSSVRSLHVGGAPVHLDLKQGLIKLFGDDCLFEGYGSTELQYVTVMPPNEHLAKPGSCGRPYKGVSIRIIGDDGKEVRCGDVGELHVKTPMLFLGYIQDGEIRRQDIDSEGYFHTGDMARLDTDGYLYIVDRKKDMIIRGGVNIYPAEVEAVLLEHPDVVDAAVFGVPDFDLGEVVIAYVVPRSDQNIEFAGLRKHCAERLSSYKVPAEIISTKDFPRNAMNKTLKRELREVHLADQKRN